MIKKMILMVPDSSISCDVLVIGTGIAGCSAALELAETGIDFIMVTSAKDPEETNTEYAQGGIVYKCEEDPALLKKDIMEAGAGISNEESLRIVSGEGPFAVEEVLMKKLDVPFTRNADGSLHLTREAAHSGRRIAHVNDSTGKSIEELFIKKIGEYSNVMVLSNHTLVDILTLPHHSIKQMPVNNSNKCVGAYVLDNERSIVKTIVSKKTILATGGVGQIYLRTANSVVSRGDGLYAAFRAGAKIRNAEYVQFHPTSLYHRDVSNFLITEALRGEGAIIKNREGESFMEKHDERASMASRDIVTRGIFREMLSSGESYVLLDAASNISAEKIKSHFSMIYEKCLKLGIDITKDPLPIAPTAHYFCGGIEVDAFGRTNIDNLYAVGEVSYTGVHGANRLASTSLLECLVWGRSAAKDIMKVIGNEKKIGSDDILPWRYTHRFEKIDPALIQQDWLMIKSIMWNYVGIIRTRKRLERAVSDLLYLKLRIEEFYRDAKICDSLVGLRNGIGTALLIAEAAMNNKESRGCHYIENGENKI